MCIRDRKNDFKGYVVTHSLVAKEVPENKIGSLMDSLGNRKFNKNLKFNLGGVIWSHSQEKAHKEKALKQAVIACKKKAQTMATAAGVGLGSLYNLSHQQQVSRPRPPVYARAKMMMDSAESATSLSPGEVSTNVYDYCRYRLR